jgi:V8-like Glu-specific endopeptidase
MTTNTNSIEMRADSAEAEPMENEIKTVKEKDANTIACTKQKIAGFFCLFLLVGFGLGFLTGALSFPALTKFAKEIDDRFQEETLQYQCLFKSCCRSRDSTASNSCESKNLFECVLDSSDICEWECDANAIFPFQFYDGQPMIKVFAGFSQGKGVMPSEDISVPIATVPNAVSDFISDFIPLDIIGFNDVEVYDPECGVIYKYYTTSALHSTETNEPNSSSTVVGHLLVGSATAANASIPRRRRRRMGVLGPDDRTQVTQNLSPAFAQTGLLLFDTAQGTSRCTGTLISYRVVITAAHCCWNGDYYTNFRFYPGILDQSGVTPDNAYEAAAGGIFVFSGYMQGQSYWDVGLIRLARSPNVGALGFARLPNPALPAVTNLYINGYPADKPNYSKWVQFCSYTTNGPEFTTTTCDTSGGSSGSAIYSFDNVLGGLYVLAIHYGTNYVTNFGTTINPTVFNRICSFIHVTNPSRC